MHSAALTGLDMHISRHFVKNGYVFLARISRTTFSACSRCSQNSAFACIAL
jgi:hypothetical protein